MWNSITSPNSWQTYLALFSPALRLSSSRSWEDIRLGLGPSQLNRKVPESQTFILGRAGTLNINIEMWCDLLRPDVSITSRRILPLLCRLWRQIMSWVCPAVRTTRWTGALQRTCRCTLSLTCPPPSQHLPRHNNHILGSVSQTSNRNFQIKSKYSKLKLVTLTE